MPDPTALHHEDLLRQSAMLIAAGQSQNQAAKLLGISSANLTRWRKDFERGGLEALSDKRSGASGRKPLATLDEQEELLAKQYLCKTESKTSALRLLAEHPSCRPEVADAINKQRRSKHTITRALRDQITLPQAVINYHKSPRNVRVNCFINPRTLTYFDALGAERPLTPGDLFERDDMSNNFLCWVPWPWGGDPCSDRYKVRIARGQNLLMIDVASLFFISFNFLVRLRDSYRADDIWQWVGQTYRDIGKPRIGERWERGTWASKRLRGDREAAILPGHTDESARLGGMAALGLRVIESHSPTTKVIENRFNFLQTQMQTLPGQIGRKRGEMERENKIWTACRQGHRDPRDYFMSFEQACEAIESKLHYVNSEPVEGSVYRGIPAAKWAESIAANPLTKLSPDEGHLFSRDRAEITARKGHVQVRYTTPEGQNASWHFCHPDLWRHEGQKVAVYYDHYTPGAGAVLVPMQGRAGQVLGHADLVSGSPQFTLGERAEPRDGIERKTAFMDAVRSEYRSLDIHNRRIARATRADDGHGREAEIRTGGTGILPVGTAGVSPATDRSTRPSSGDDDADFAAIRARRAEALASGDFLPS